MINHSGLYLTCLLTLLIIGELNKPTYFFLLRLFHQTSVFNFKLVISKC